MDKTASCGRSSQFRSPESIIGFEFQVVEEDGNDNDNGGFGGKDSIELKN